MTKNKRGVLQLSTDICSFSTKWMEPSSPLLMTMKHPPPAPFVALVEPDDAEVTSNLSSEASQCEDQDTSASWSAEPTSICGYLWKFPSEGSIETAGRSQQEDKSYPRKCQRCGTCWVSDAANEVAHKRNCQLSAHRGDNRVDGGGSTAKLGPARRVFCEIDEQQAMLQVVKADVALSPDSVAHRFDVAVAL
jgi:hypothetical protein